MSPDRIFNRHGRPSVNNPTSHRGIRHQPFRHVIKKGVARYRIIKRGNEHIKVMGMFAAELHATKGWRTVPAWS